MEAEKRKAQVLIAAADVFAEKGYLAAGVADIIERAKIARGTFYLYFKNKKQAFLEVVSHITYEIAERLRFVDPSDRARSVVQQFRENLRDVFRYLAENPQMARILLQQAVCVDEDAEQQIGEGTRMIGEVIRDYLAEGQKAGVLREFNADTFSHLILGAIREVACARAVSGTLKASIDELVEAVVRFTCFGILQPDLAIE